MPLSETRADHLTAKGETIKSALVKEYGAAKGEQVLYAGKNAGTFSGIDDAKLDSALVRSEMLLGKADAICAKADDHRVVGGVGFKSPA